jgi:hypothetical protein
MILPVIAPVVPVLLLPGLVAILLIGPVVRIGGHFVFLPHSLPGALTLLLAAVALIL